MCHTAPFGHAHFTWTPKALLLRSLWKNHYLSKETLKIKNVTKANVFLRYWSEVWLWRLLHFPRMRKIAKEVKPWLMYFPSATKIDERQGKEWEHSGGRKFCLCLGQGENWYLICVWGNKGVRGWCVNKCLKKQVRTAKMRERSFYITRKDILKSIDI